jgi:hypothetical protein
VVLSGGGETSFRGVKWFAACLHGRWAFRPGSVCVCGPGLAWDTCEGVRPLRVNTCEPGLPHRSLKLYATRFYGQGRSQV